MPIDKIQIDVLFVSSVGVAQMVPYVPSSWLKSLMHKNGNFKSAKSRLESNIKVGIERYLFLSRYIHNVQEGSNCLIQPEGLPQKFLLQ